MTVKIEKRTTNKQILGTTRVLGLDPSTKTGYCVLESGLKVLEYGEIHKDGKGIPRAIRYGEALVEIVATYAPHFAVIEGYGYANMHSLVTLVEIGTILRVALHTERVKFGLAAPNTLKKFVTGKGNSKKDAMMLSCYKNWGFEGTDNEVDAFGLAALGLYANDPETHPKLTAPQRDCLDDWRRKNIRLLN